MERVVSFTPWLLYTWRRMPLVPIEQRDWLGLSDGLWRKETIPCPLRRRGEERRGVGTPCRISYNLLTFYPLYDIIISCVSILKSTMPSQFKTLLVFFFRGICTLY
jgi:hypothetical protein